MPRLKSYIKKILFGDETSNLKKYRQNGLMKQGANNITEGLQLEIRDARRQDEAFKLEQDNVISGKFVLETQNAKISIGSNTFIGGGLFVCADEIKIGSDVMFSWGCTVIDTDAHSLDWKRRSQDVKDWKKGLDEGSIGKYKDWSHVVSKKIEICDKAWIGFNAVILKGVTIGEGAVVAAGSVVTKDVLPYSLVAGNPAVEIKKLITDL